MISFIVLLGVQIMIDTHSLIFGSIPCHHDGQKVSGMICCIPVRRSLY